MSLTQFKQMMASIDRIFVILDEADEQPEATHLETISSPKGAIEFKMFNLATHQKNFNEEC